MARGRRRAKGQTARPPDAKTSSPPPVVSQSDASTPVGLPSDGDTVEIEAQSNRSIVLDVAAPTAVTVARRGGDLRFDFGTDGTLLIRGFMALHEDGKAPPLAVGQAAVPAARIAAALQAGEAQYGDGGVASQPGEPGAAPVVAVPDGDGVGVVGLIGPDGLAFEMPQVGAEAAAAGRLPRLATDKVFALPEDLPVLRPIVGRLFDEDDPGAPTRYLSTTGTFRTAQGGSVMIGVDGLFEYKVPDGGFDGEDSFAFTVSDGVRSDTATVTVVAAPVAAAIEIPQPSAPMKVPAATDEAAPAGDAGHGYETVQDSALDVGPEHGLLAEAFAAGQLAAQILSAGTIVTAEGGNVQMDADGAFAYMPRPGFVGTDHFAVTMESGEGDPERVLSVAIEVVGAPNGQNRETAPRFAMLEIPVAAGAADDRVATVTVALAESREVVRPAHYLALDYHDGSRWTPFANGGDVPIPSDMAQLTLRALALDEAGNPLFQTPDAFEVAAIAPDGSDLIDGDPRCWLTDSATADWPAEEILDDTAGDDQPEAAAPEYAYFGIPLTEGDRVAGTVTVRAFYDEQPELPHGASMQLEYLDGLAWMPFGNGDTVPATGDSLHVRAALTAADGAPLPADPDRLTFSLAPDPLAPDAVAVATPARLPEVVGSSADGPGDALETVTEIDVPLPPAPHGNRSFSLWASDEEGEVGHLDLAYRDGGRWRSFASGDVVTIRRRAAKLRVKLSLLDEDGQPVPANLHRFRLEAVPVAPTNSAPIPATDMEALPEAADVDTRTPPDSTVLESVQPGAAADGTDTAAPPVDHRHADLTADHADKAAEEAEAGVTEPGRAEPASADSEPALRPLDRPDFVFHGERVDHTDGQALPLAFDALAWALPADADWPLPWRGAVDAGARRAALRADDAPGVVAEDDEPEPAPVQPSVEATDFDPGETYSLIFNIDVSGSMAWSFDGRQKPALMYEESRLGVSVDAIKRLLRLFVDEGFAGRTRVRFQPFTNRFVEDDAAGFANLTDMPGIERYLDGLFAGGVTRYEPVMEAAAEWFAQPENRGRFNRIYVVSDGGDNVGYQPISTTVRQLYTAYNGPGQANLDIFAYGLGAGADELDPERLGALRTGKVVLDPLAPSEAAEKASVILVTAPENLFAVLADTAPSADLPTQLAFGSGGGVVMGGEGESDRPVGIVRNRLVLSWQLGDEGTIAHPAVSTVPEFRLGSVDKDPLASVADISGLLPASLARRPRDLSAYVQAGVRGRDLEIQVDVDGSIQGFQPQQIVILRGCGAAFSPEAESDSILKGLIDDGNLVIASQR